MTSKWNHFAETLLLTKTQELSSLTCGYIMQVVKLSTSAFVITDRFDPLYHIVRNVT